MWGEAKRYTCAHCDYSFAGLERTVIPALDSVRLGTIRKYFRKCREYMEAYRESRLEEVMWKRQYKSINLTDVFFEMLINYFICCSLPYLKKLLCIFNTSICVPLHKSSPLTHAPLSFFFFFYICMVCVFKE